MKRIYWIALLLLQGITSMAQVGVGAALGRSSLSTVSSIGRGDTLGLSSTPHCIASVTTCGTPLPLNFLDFTGKRETPAYVGLTWKTANEISNSGFWVQRSLGNAGNFNPIFFVPAMIGDEPIKQYQRPDTNTFRGTTYYRLQQVDIDGNTSYSKTIAVAGYPTDNTLVAFPNPSTGRFYLKYPLAADGRPDEIRVYNSFGQVIYDGRTTSIDLSTQANGTYLIECLQDRPVFTKVILLK